LKNSIIDNFLSIMWKSLPSRPRMKFCFSQPKAKFKTKFNVERVQIAVAITKMPVMQDVSINKDMI